MAGIARSSPLRDGFPLLPGVCNSNGVHFIGLPRYRIWLGPRYSCPDYGRNCRQARLFGGGVGKWLPLMHVLGVGGFILTTLTLTQDYQYSIFNQQIFPMFSYPLVARSVHYRTRTQDLDILIRPSYPTTMGPQLSARLKTINIAG